MCIEGVTATQALNVHVGQKATLEDEDQDIVQGFVMNVVRVEKGWLTKPLGP